MASVLVPLHHVGFMLLLFGFLLESFWPPEFFFVALLGFKITVETNARKNAGLDLPPRSILDHSCSILDQFGLAFGTLGSILPCHVCKKE